MPRRRYQKGSLILKGTREKVWYARFLDDVIVNGQTTRVHRSERLGTMDEYPTRKLAARAMEQRMAMVNSATYKPTVFVTFADFAKKWQDTILPQHKPSSQLSEGAHCKRLIAEFGLCALSDLNTQRVQMFVTSLSSNGHSFAPKYVRNIMATFRTMWNTAKAWGYVQHNPIEGLALPRPNAAQPPCYSLEQVKKIIQGAKEPYKTLFWIVAETGIRGGEVCGLGVDDIDFNTRTITVWRSAWCKQLQSPKTPNAVRCFPISGELLDHVREYLSSTWKDNPDRLLFAKDGKALNNYNLVKSVLHPLTKRLGFPRGGLHALRHMNATELDRLNVPVAVRRERLGHAQFSTTLHYTHAVSEDHRRVATEFGKLLKSD